MAPRARPGPTLVALCALACAPAPRRDHSASVAVPRCDPPPTRAARARALSALEGGCSCDARGVCAMSLSPPSFLRGRPMPALAEPALRRELLRDAAPWLRDGGLIDALVCAASAPTRARAVALAREVVADLAAVGADPSRVRAVAGPVGEVEDVRCEPTRVEGVALARWDGERFAAVLTLEDGAPACPSSQEPAR